MQQVRGRSIQHGAITSDHIADASVEGRDIGEANIDTRHFSLSALQGIREYLTSVNSAIRTTMSANQTIPANTWRKVSFNVKALDRMNEYTTASQRFTASQSGTFHLHTAIKWAAQAYGVLQSIAVYINGVKADMISESVVGGRVGSTYSLLTSGYTSLQLNQGDYVEVWVYQSVSGSVQMAGSFLRIDQIS